MTIDRRRFLRTAASLAVLGPVPIVSASGDPPGSADEGLVRLLIDADRERLLDQLVDRIRAGLAYSTLLGAVAEASARRVSPYPSVGYKYHALMVLHAVDRTTRLSPGLGRPEDRWLPVLWAADVFKGAQAAEEGRGDWSLGLFGEESPAGGRALEAEFRRAMENWDPQAATAALIGLWRTRPREAVFDLLFRYGARDFRAIGHKAISVANCHRLLEVISPGHAEPLLRSLVLALLNHRGEPNPGRSDLAPDRPWRRNLSLVGRDGAGPMGSDDAGTGGESRITDLLDGLREGSDAEASRLVSDGLTRGIPETDVWTALFAAAGDQMLKDGGIIAVHANTTLDALYYGYREVGDADTRRLLLLQTASFLPLFRALVAADRRRAAIDSLEPVASDPDPRQALADVFATIEVDRLEAARKALGVLNAGDTEAGFMGLARRYVVDRNQGYHDYKFAEAAFANAAAVRAPWRNRYLAASVIYLNGSAAKPDRFVARARAALAGAGA